MTVLDFISVFDENKKLFLDAIDAETGAPYTVTFYDGKNAIDEKYNDYKIAFVSIVGGVCRAFIEK